MTDIYSWMMSQMPDKLAFALMKQGSPFECFTVGQNRWMSLFYQTMRHASTWQINHDSAFCHYFQANFDDVVLNVMPGHTSGAKNSADH